MNLQSSGWIICTQKMSFYRNDNKISIEEAECSINFEKLNREKRPETKKRKVHLILLKKKAVL